MRLQVYLAHRGVASRRKAEEMIKEGRVKVNGVLVEEMGIQVEEGDVVAVDGKTLPQELSKRKTYAFYKPQGVLSTTSDDRGRATVSDYFSGMGRLYPVGRLDYLSEGLLLVTDDGDLAQRLTHPKHDHAKIYEVHTDRVLTQEDMQQLKKGVVIDGYKTRPIEIEEAGKKTYRLTLKEGRNRQIRKMMDRIGVKVDRLLRIQVAGITLGKLQPGQWRLVSQKEMEKL